MMNLVYGIQSKSPSITSYFLENSSFQTKHPPRTHLQLSIVTPTNASPRGQRSFSLLTTWPIGVGAHHFSKLPHRNCKLRFPSSESRPRSSSSIWFHKEVERKFLAKMKKNPTEIDDEILTFHFHGVLRDELQVVQNFPGGRWTPFQNVPPGWTHRVESETRTNEVSFSLVRTSWRELERAFARRTT